MCFPVCGNSLTPAYSLSVLLSTWTETSILSSPRRPAAWTSFATPSSCSQPCWWSDIEDGESWPVSNITPALGRQSRKGGVLRSGDLGEVSLVGAVSGARPGAVSDAWHVLWGGRWRSGDTWRPWLYDIRTEAEKEDWEGDWMNLIWYKQRLFPNSLEWRIQRDFNLNIERLTSYLRFMIALVTERI